MCAGSRGSTLAACDVNTLQESTSERVRRRTWVVGDSSDEGDPHSSGRGLLPPLMNEEVMMDLNHEL